MPNPNPKTEHLPKGTKKQLEALGVKPLEAGELSKTVRVRGSEALFGKLSEMNPKEIGEVLEKALELTVKAKG